MKKIYVVFIFSFLTIILSSCFRVPNTVGLSKEKYDIVSKKYGGVEYLNEGILIYDNLKELFDEVTGVSYIIENSGNRGSVHPEIRKHFYLLVDIVKHEDEIKMLLYNNLMKKGASKDKMFILTDYNLPIKLEGLETFFIDHGYDQMFKDFQINVLKKDKNINTNLMNNDDLSIAYYNKAYNNKVFMSLYDYNTGNVIVGDTYEGYFGNVIDKVIFSPSYTNYNDVINEDDNSLKEDEVKYIIDVRNNYGYVPENMEDYDILHESKNTQKAGRIFFVAFTYEEFLSEYNKVNQDVFSSNDEQYKNLFNSLKDTYKEEFFIDNILIFYYNKYYNNLYSITKENDTLKVNINSQIGFATTLNTCINVIVIEKEDIAGVNKADLIIRTINYKQKTVTFGIEKEYIRDMYLNGKTMDDFKDVDNLKSVSVWTNPLKVELTFNKTMTEDDLDIIVNYLNENPLLSAATFIGKDYVHLTLDNSFYDKVVDRTLVISDIIFDQQLIKDYSPRIDFGFVYTFGYMTFLLIEPGMDNVNLMGEELNKDKYPFLTYQDDHSDPVDEFYD